MLCVLCNIFKISTWKMNFVGNSEEANDEVKHIVSL